MKRRPKITEFQFDKFAAELEEWIHESVSPFADDSAAAQADRIERSRTDRHFFFSTYLPHYFPAAPCRMHEEWDELADIKNELVLLAASRGHAKSTWWSCGLPLHDICHKVKHFIMLISDTRELATEFTLAIRMEIEENPRLIHDFGDLQASYGRREPVWKRDDFTTTNGVRIMARGRGDTFRGKKNGPHRLDRAIIDDFENDQNVRNPALVRKGVDLILQAILPSTGPEFSATIVGNLFAKRSVMAQLMAERDENNQPVHISRIYDCYTPENEPVWPEVWPKERLEQMRRILGTVRFNREFRNMVTDEDSPFREEWLRYIELLIPKKWRVSTFLDPSAKSGQANDYKALVTVGCHDDMNMDVINAWIKKASVMAMLTACYAVIEEFGGNLGVEENMFHDFLRTTFDNEAMRRKRHLPLFYATHTQQKEGRIINTLSPLVEFGRLRFVRGNSDQDRLVEQLVYVLDANVNDDGPDALEGAVSMLQGGWGYPIESQGTGVKRIMAKLKGFVNG